AIPASTFNFVKYARDGEDNLQTSNDVVLGNPLQPSPAALICMDGVTQPRLIFQDGTTRACGTYSTWTLDEPEYVPIARFPVFVDEIVYCVGKDLRGNFTQIYRSVTGQPLNYVILVDKDGKKTSGLESEGGAPALATRVSQAPVTATAIANV